MTDYKEEAHEIINSFYYPLTNDGTSEGTKTRWDEATKIAILSQQRVVDSLYELRKEFDPIGISFLKVTDKIKEAQSLLSELKSRL